MKPRGCAIWFSGLPGSGKSAIAACVTERLQEVAHMPGFPYTGVVHFAMDDVRRRYTPNPVYTEEERTRAYGLFADEALGLVRAGRLVLMDGVAHRLRHRAHARVLFETAGVRFFEVHVDVELQTAMARESSREGGQVMAELYSKALRRRDTGEQFEGLGQVPGVDVPYESSSQAELRLPNDDLTLQEACDACFDFVMDVAGLASGLNTH